MTNPVSKTDAVFLKHFAQLIAFLVAVAIVLIALAAYIYGKNPPEGNPDAPKVLADRIAPVGGVYAGDMEAAHAVGRVSPAPCRATSNAPRT